jgi:hypothetical protein
MTSIEATRLRYRPQPITTLFVGESAPAGGTFFYYGNSSMARYMKAAMEAAGLMGDEDFLARFKSFGWYLDDLVLAPVNHLTPPERKAQCRGAQKSLADRVAKYQPRAIVTLLIGISPIVTAAANAAGSTVPRYAVHFPGNGQQANFRADMVRILPVLPRLKDRARA